MSDVKFQYLSNSRSDVGRVRRVNEDACLDRSQSGLWAVADGMGGHAAGDVASGMVVDTLGALEQPLELPDFVDRIEDSLMDVNRRLRELRAERDSDTIGCTVVVLVLCNGFGLCIWAGDSRIYRFRDGRLEQITRDHALVEELVVKGILSREAARNHPQANLITRAVGAADQLFLDLEIVSVNAGDQFLLCSDGLTGEVRDKDIESLLNEAGPEDKSSRLVDMALHNGGRDNTTVVVVQVSAVE